VGDLMIRHTVDRCRLYRLGAQAVPDILAGIDTGGDRRYLRQMLAPRRGRLCWRLLHHHEPRQLQMADQPLGSDPGHELISRLGAFPTVEPKGEGNSLFDIVIGGGCEWRA